jgi:hypothetical protein
MSSKKDNFTINISEKYKSFVWAPPKTGTTHLFFVLRHFDFEGLSVNYDRTDTTRIYDYVTHNHSTNLFLGHENYKLILSARNPYSTAFSYYCHMMSNGDVSIENFRNYIYDNFPPQQSRMRVIFQLETNRKPDYVLRVETLYEDYTKIPFVRNSLLNTSGILKDLCNKKMNRSKYDLPSFKKFYNKELADLVYYSCPNYFEFMGYHKDSWMDID